MWNKKSPWIKRLYFFLTDFRESQYDEALAKQDAFLKCVAKQFPGVPRRYCENHFFRDLAKPVLDLDSTAKTKMRAKLGGLRTLEREILDALQAAARPSSANRKQSSSLAVAHPS